MSSAGTQPVKYEVSTQQKRPSALSPSSAIGSFGSTAVS